jgi:transcriptional regulator with XRE-family HTH domain
MKKPNPIDANVGARVRLRRLVLGLSQSEVGKAVNVSFQQVHKYENRTNRISASCLQHLADFFHVTISYFFEDACSEIERGCDSTQDKRRGQSAGSLVTSERIQLSRAFLAVRDARVRKALLALIVSIAGERQS